MDRPTFVFEHQGQTHAVPVVIYVASTNSGGPPDTDNMLERVAHTDQLTIIVIVRFEHTQLAAMLLQAYRSKAQANDGRVSGGDIAATLQAVMASTDTDEDRTHARRPRPGRDTPQPGPSSDPPDNGTVATHTTAKTVGPITTADPLPLPGHNKPLQYLAATPQRGLRWRNGSAAAL